MSQTDPLADYLDSLSLVRSLNAGTPETSYYPALSSLFNAVGKTLSPPVFCLSHVSGKRAGIPDFGLFERPNRLKRGETPEWREGVPPDRGVIEVKGIDQTIDRLVASDQVQRQYLPAFGLVLVTNLFQFRLISRDGVIDRFDLADTAADFIALLHGVRPKALGIRFTDFISRCLLTAAPLATPAQLAFFLASYARDSLALLDERAALPALASLRQSMEQTLELSFDAKEGEHLFRSTLVQTLFYGLFSAWIVEARAGRAGRFDWRSAQWSLTVPIARFLFQQVATPEALAPLGIVGLLDAAAGALARVDKPAFFTAFRETEAVQYFYEPFLEYFDPQLRRDLGVWYTPPEIVTYMVERVDRLLRSELGIADGLADESVVVLDPCCGTGSFLVAVLARIRRTLEGKGLGSLVGAELKRAAMTRVHGFEIMTAPLVIAHWQIGEALAEAGAPLGMAERASVFLTNALTGWSESGEKPPIPGFEMLTQERSAARVVKRAAPILVVLGNPPYNAYAGTAPEAEGDLVTPYKAGLQSEWGVKKFNLDDLYVRFFRIAERRIAEGAVGAAGAPRRGIVAYISNYSWLSGASFVVMRKRLLESFDRIWIDNLNGDSRETGKVTPEGEPDPSVFSTERNREGIRVGTAIAMLVRTGARS
ncbi:N-6 DNA methylase [Acidiphilium sp. PA]|uniref:N-6 DNA methylase n=1 Tax=Acidiphilium sp. PA TaxID=2871705 RepID=UPI002243AC6E|nr:N-6 DNA methylase [Acidiphilium sp. PA]MCW8306610.1 N-6 DNA methylase [Acidiphilium sp. PA]